MSVDPSRTPTSAPGPARRLDAVCDRFEAAWRTDARPRLEAFLLQVEEEDRPAILLQLLALDLDYRLRRGERPRREEYRERLPEYAGVIDALFSVHTSIGPDEPVLRVEVRGEPGGVDAATPLRPGPLAASTPSLASPDSEQAQTGPISSSPSTETDRILPPRAGRYGIEGEIGRGGMGIVLRARDDDLHRSLAVKVLSERHRGDSELEQRFREEAQITGQLQHPGIPPVHEVGRLPDGRPFMAMKLIKGRTLAELLHERPTPAADLPRFLGIFEHVCQTLAYAHSRGVIHRDLKPLNVMVGEFGEVQVMDWGLAKVLGGDTAEPRAADRAVTTVRSAEPDLASQPGAVIGTPAYMAPEQARGQTTQIDERCDVFGLGAVLCEILTGRPPYVADRRDDVLFQAVTGSVTAAFTRLEACGADLELVRLCQECLAPEPAARPRDAGVAAQRMLDYQAGVQQRLRQSELERAAAQVKAAEERKRRRLAVGLAAAVLCLIVVGGGAAVWLQQQRAELRQGVHAALDVVAGLRQQTRWWEAGAVLEEARQRVGPTGPEDLRRQLEQAQQDLALARRLDGIRQRRAALVANDFDEQSADHDYEAAFRGAGLWQEGEREEVVAARVRDSAIHAELMAALDDWASLRMDLSRRAWLLGVASRAAPADDGGARFRDLKLRDNRAALRQEVEQADVKSLSPQVLTTVGLLMRELKMDPLPWWTAARERHPNDFWLNYYLGTALRQAHKPAEAIGYYRAAQALRPDSAAVHITLGNAQGDRGELNEAVREYRRALELEPDVALTHNHLGLALRAQGKLDDAIQAFRRALELDPQLFPARIHLGLALKDKGQIDLAIAEYRHVLALVPGHAAASNNLGLLLLTKKEPDEAIRLFRQAVEADPSLPSAQANLGLALLDTRQWSEAIAAFRKAVDLDPNDVRAHYGLGVALKKERRFAEAQRAFRRAAELFPEGGDGRKNARTQMQELDRFVVLDKKLTAVLQGESEPAGAEECLTLGRFALAAKHQFVASVRFYTEAFAAQPESANDLKTVDRYNAACAAVQASFGLGEDADKLDEPTRARLRQQALDWLKADLALWARQAASEQAGERKVAQETMQNWQRDSDLAGVRDPEALAKLSTVERADWQSLWEEVTALRQKTQR